MRRARRRRAHRSGRQLRLHPNQGLGKVLGEQQRDAVWADGLGFNGVTQGAACGDDAQAATNFPLGSITNLRISHVFYSRRHDHSSMAVASNEPVSTPIDGLRRRLSFLQLVANGIASQPVLVLVH